MSHRHEKQYTSPRNSPHQGPISLICKYAREKGQAKNANSAALHLILREWKAWKDRQHLKAPSAWYFAEKNRGWWESLELRPTEHLRVKRDLRGLDHLAEQLKEVVAELSRLSITDPGMSTSSTLCSCPALAC